VNWCHGYSWRCSSPGESTSREAVGLHRPKQVLILLLLAGALSCSSRRRFADSIPTPNWADFSQNVTKYTELVDGLEANLAPVPEKADAQRIVAHKRELAQTIIRSRSSARQGDLFTPSIRRRFIDVVRSEVHGTAGKPAERAIQEDNPNVGRKGPPVRLAVNAVYPDSAPLSTVPASLLLRLPDLPKTVDYRFVGKALVLRDVRAGVIVDYIRNVLL